MLKLGKSGGKDFCESKHRLALEVEEISCRASQGRVVGMEIVCVYVCVLGEEGVDGFFLLGSGNLARCDFDHSKQFFDATDNIL